jgi:hypothetical protein
MARRIWFFHIVSNFYPSDNSISSIRSKDSVHRFLGSFKLETDKLRSTNSVSSADL